MSASLVAGAKTSAVAVDARGRRAFGQTGQPPRRRWQTLVRHLERNGSGVVGGVLLVALVLVAVGAPLLAPQGYSTQELGNALRPPIWSTGGSTAHPLGTDSLGRDVLSRMIWAARVSLGIAAVSALVAMSAGVLLGLISGYYEGWSDAVIMRVADVQFAFPYLLLAIAVMVLLGPSLTNLIVILALPGWMVYARTVRASILSLKRFEFALIIVEASLSFLGVGIQPPMPSWGSMLSQGREYLTTAWRPGVFPGIAIALTVLGATLLGDGLRDALDPRLKV